MVYLRLFHGRDTLDETPEDWGYDGPTIGPCEYFHITYALDIKFNKDGRDERLEIHDGCVAYEGKFYGDFSITAKP